MRVPSFAEATDGKPSFAEATDGKPSFAEATDGKPSFAEATDGSVHLERKKSDLIFFERSEKSCSLVLAYGSNNKIDGLSIAWPKWQICLNWPAVDLENLDTPEISCPPGLEKLADLSAED